MNEFYHKTNIEGENMARPMTMAEKILAAHAGLEEVGSGQLIECDLDLVLSNDVTAPIAIKEFKKVGVDKVFDPTKIALVPDHYVPNKDIQSAEQAKMTREFAREQGITHFYEVGCMGVEHALLPEQGVVGAGDLIIGADSHTCTYGALGAFATGVGSTDAAIGYATGKAWFKVPESILFNVEGQLQPGVTGRDIILHIIGMIGVDGALYQAMEFRGSAIESLARMNVSPFQIWQSRQAAKQVLLPLMRLPAPIWMAVPSVPIRNIIPIPMRFMQRYTTSMQLTLFLRLHSLIFLPILVQQQKRVILPSISLLLALARMVVLKICVKRLRF